MAAMPRGRLIRKIQCQLACSISQPPMIGPEDGAEQHRDAEDRHQAAHPRRAGGPGHDRHAERHQHAAAESLEHPEGDQHLDRGRGRAERGAQREQADRGEVEPLGAEPVGRPAGQGDDRRQREGVARDRPRHRGVGERVVDAGEGGLERREGDVDDGDVEDRHDRAENDDAGDLEDGAVDVVGVLGGCAVGRGLCHRSSVGSGTDTPPIRFAQMVDWGGTARVKGCDIPVNAVPISGPATLRVADPPGAGVVEFTDLAHTVALPIREALPVLARARREGRPHPTRGPARGGEPAGPAPGRRRPLRARRGPLAPVGARPGRGRAGAPAGGRCGGVRRWLGHRRGGGRPRPGGRRGRRPAPWPADRAGRVLPAGAWTPSWPGPGARPRRCPRWSPSRCASRPPRRSWSPARCGWCSRCTTSWTRCTSATPPCCGPRDPTTTVSVSGPAPTPPSRCVRRPRLAGARPAAGAARPRRDRARHRRAGLAARGRRGRPAPGRRRRALAAQPRPGPDDAGHPRAPRRRRRRTRCRPGCSAPRRCSRSSGRWRCTASRSARTRCASSRRPRARSSSCAAPGRSSTRPIARKAKKRLIRTVTPVQAVAAALTGTVEVEEDAAEVVVGASLLHVRERLLSARRPASPSRRRPVCTRRCATTSGTA